MSMTQHRVPGSQQQKERAQRGTRRRRRRAAAIALATGVTLLMIVAALAAPGDLDPTFNSTGKVITPIGSGYDVAYGVAVQPDGKIVTAGYSSNGANNDFALVRYNSDGTLDTSFDTDGKVTTPIGSNDELAQAVAIQPDGKIVAAGYLYNGVGFTFALARYNSNGSLDPTFNSTGKVTTSIGSSEDLAFGVAIQPDGKIVAAGYSYNGSNTDFALARYNSDGSLDTTFNSTGKVRTPVGSSDDIAVGVTVQPDGKVVVAGYSYNGANNDFALVRYSANGTLDTTFNSTGKVTTPIGSGDDLGEAVAIQPDGKIVAAGYSHNGANQDFALARYSANGTLDNTFNSTGKVTTPVGGSDDVVHAVTFQPDGKVVAAGYSIDSNLISDFALVRYNPNGTLDTSFDTDGKVTTPVGSSDAYANGAALQPDGKVVVAGYSYNGADNDFALARYQAFTVPNKTSNFDTDQQTDVAIWNPANHNWYITDSSTNSTRTILDWGNGDLGDKAVPADYDGDSKTDVAVFRASEGNWYILNSATNTITVRNWGGTGDTPVPGDYDLDGKADTAVFRPSEGNWYILNSRDNTVTVKGWGSNADKPVPADYDGDGATDIAIYRPSEGNWYIITSKDRFARVIGWGNSTDKPVPADYDGDGRVDTAVFRDGVWYIRHWTNTSIVKGWGNPIDTPVPADYDGDGKADIAVWRPSDLNWYILQSSTNTGRVATIPQPGVPVAAANLPQ